MLMKWSDKQVVLVTKFGHSIYNDNNERKREYYQIQGNESSSIAQWMTKQLLKLFSLFISSQVIH